MSFPPDRGEVGGLGLFVLGALAAFALVAALLALPSLGIGHAEAGVQVRDGLLGQQQPVEVRGVEGGDGDYGADSVAASSVTGTVTEPLVQIQNTAASFDAGATAARSVAEDAAAGAVVGAPLAVTDPDPDTLVFALSGGGGNFTVVNESGAAQIKVASGASLDHETADSHSVTVTVSDGKDATGGTDTTADDSITVTVTVSDVDEAGTVSFDSAAPLAGTALAAVLDDPDGGVTGLSWAWERLDDAADTSPVVLSGATSAALSSSYTPVPADVGKLLRASASYSDGEGAGKSAAVLSGTVARSNPQPEVIPRLREWSGGVHGTTVVLSSTSRIVVPAADAAKHRNDDSVVSLLEWDRELADVSETVKADLKEVSGLDLEVVRAAAPRAGDVFLELLDAVDAGLGSEGYVMEVADAVMLRANTSAGVFYGSRSLLQILAQSADKRTLPRGTARDWPSQQLRMINLDAGRKFFGQDYLSDAFRTMSWFKMNSFQLHAMESSGFRYFDPVQFPGLADADSSYSKSDIERLEAVAREHFVSIMPGFEFPSHATVVTDHFGIGMGNRIPSDSGPAACTGAHTRDNLRPNYTLDMTAPSAVAKAKEVVAHFAAWFSGPFVHMGSDETSAQLAGCPKVRAYIAANSDITNLGDVQVEFMNDMNATVQSLGKRMVVYDDFVAMNPSSNQTLAKDVVVMLWQTTSGRRIALATHAARHGPGTTFDIIDTNLRRLYLVAGSGNWFPHEAWIYDTWVPEPTDLGSGVAQWSDILYWADDEYIEQRLARPRALLADRTWNATTTPDGVADFYARMNAVGDPPGREGFAARTRVDDGEPSHHYKFEKRPDRAGYPNPWRTGIWTIVEDSVGGLHGGAWSLGVDSDAVAGTSFRFAAANDWAGFGGLDIAPPWTLSLWAKPTARSTNSTLLYTRHPTTGQRQFIRLQYGSASKVGFSTFAGTAHNFEYTAPLNTWTHLALVATSAATTLYVNGARHSTIDASISLPLEWIVGRDRGRAMRAKLDEMKVFDEALTAAQVATEHSSYARTAPQEVTVRPGDGTLAVRWQPPATDGGSAVSGYRVQYRAAAASTWTTVDLAHSAPAYTIRGLVNGTAYVVRVAAVNAIGTSAWSDAATATPTSTNMGTLSLDKSSYSVREGGSVAVKVNFTGGPISHAVAFTVSTADGAGSGAATSPADYTAVSRTVTIPALTTARTTTINLQTATDSIDEGDHTFTVGIATSAVGVVVSTASATVTISEAPSTDASLSGLSLSSGSLSPAFAASTSSYTASVANTVSSITVTPTAGSSRASITVQRTGRSAASVASGSPSGSIPLAVGANTITVVVSPEDTMAADRTYTVTVTRSSAPPPPPQVPPPQGPPPPPQGPPPQVPPPQVPPPQVPPPQVPPPQVPPPPGRSGPSDSSGAGPEETVEDDAFEDIDEAGSLAGDVAALAADGIFEGTECAPDRFCPRQPVLRRHLAVWMVRVIDGGDPPDTGSSPFVDVDADLWWAPHVTRLAELGITLGCQVDPTAPKRFCPDDPVSREQMAAFLGRAFNLAPAPSAGFTDVGEYWATDHINALYAAGITRGCGTDPLKFCPKDTTTRAQMAAFLNRARNRPDPAPQPPTPA